MFLHETENYFHFTFVIAVLNDIYVKIITYFILKTGNVITKKCVLFPDFLHHLMKKHKKRIH